MYLQEEFRDYNVDVEYKRAGESRSAFRYRRNARGPEIGMGKRSRFPDVIVQRISLTRLIECVAGVGETADIRISESLGD
jgi:hypothetical protein